MIKAYEQEKEIEEQEEETVCGECMFCHQFKVIPHVHKALTDEEKVKLATMECDCPAAKGYQERTYQKNSAEERLDNMLQMAEEDAALDILKKAVGAIIDDQIWSISINIGNGVKVSMQHGKEGTVKIKRQEVETREETV